MGNEDVNIKIVGDDASTLAMWKRQQAENQKLQDRLDRLGKTGKRAGNEVKSGFDGALGTFGKFAGAVTGVGGAVAGVSLAANQLFTEFRRIKELQQTDADKQVEFEGSLVNAVRNAGGFFTGEEIKKTILNLGDDTGVSPALIADVVSSTLSARGANTKAQAQEAIAGTKAALNFAPELDSESASILAGASVDLSKKTGFSPQESIGLAQNVGSLAHVSKPRDIAQNVIPGLNALIDFKNSAQESGSLIAAITQGTQDFTGASSRTSAIQLAKQIEDRGIGSNTAEGIQILQNDEKLRKKFLEGGTFNGKTFPKASFEAAAGPTIKNLLDANTDLAKSFKAGIGQIGGRKEAAQTYDSTVAEVKSVTQTSRLQRRVDAASDTANINDVQGGQAAGARYALSKALDSANFSDLRKKVLLGEFESRSGVGKSEPFVVAESILEREREALLKTTERIEAGFKAAGDGLFTRSVEVPRKVTKEDKQSARELGAIEMILEDMLAEQKKAAAVQQRQADENKQVIQDVVKEVAKSNNSPQPAATMPERNPPYRAPAAALGVTRDQNK